MKKKLLVNKAMCNVCNDVLYSKHRHDFVTCTCGNLSVDGGEEYIRRVYNDKNFITELSLYDDDSFELLRDNIFRGGRGINGDEPLKYVKLSKLNDNWLTNLIEYESKNRPDNFYLEYYKKELEYRKDNKIKINEK